MATRLPRSGLKMAKMANLMVMGDSCDRRDTLDTWLSGAGWRGAWRRWQGCTGPR